MNTLALRLATILGLASLSLGSTAYAYCTPPSPPSELSKPEKPTPPEAPFCINTLAHTSSCDAFETEEYNSDVDDYNEALQQYKSSVADFIKTLQEYADAALEYAKCEVNSLD